jgi:hypothetical protein
MKLVEQEVTVEEARLAALQDRARRLSSNEDVLCLHAICIRYVLRRVKDDPLFQYQMIGTESYARLTAALAEIEEVDVDDLRLPGYSGLA